MRAIAFGMLLACGCMAGRETTDTTGAADTAADDDSGDEVGDEAPVDEVVHYVFASSPPPGSIPRFTCEYVQSDCPSACGANTAPVLSAPKVYVNGATGGSPQVGDVVELRFFYTDADDTMGCGTLYRSLSAPLEGWDEAESLCSNMPANTAQGVVLAIRLDIDEAGSWQAGLKVEDGCGDPSEWQLWSATVP